MDVEMTSEQDKPLVLIADDEDYALLLLQRVLERQGFRTESATDGNMAVAKARALLPDLIVMDIQMPGLDGFEAVSLLRQDPATSRIPIILVTAAAREPADVARGLGLGADDYLRKPYNTGELVARARTKIRAHQLEERLQQRTEELEALIRIGSEFNQELALDELADRILREASAQFPASHAALILVDGHGRPSLSKWWGWDGDHPTPQTILNNRALPGYALLSGEPVLVADVAQDRRLTAIFDGENCQSGIATSLKHHGQILGALALGNEITNCFSEGNLRVLRSIAEQAALAIRNAELYTQLQGYAQGLESMVEARTADLQTAQAQLVRAEKLVSVGTLAAGVAHEVNNPLQSIQMLLEYTIDELTEKRQVDRNDLDRALSEVKRISRIVAGLLEFARPGRSDHELVDINETVLEVLSLANKQLEHTSVQVETTLGSSQRIHGNSDQLKQVFLNLILNAMDAMPGGGRLSIDTTQRDEQIVISVEDTGIGIPAQDIPQLFDPFFTTKADGTGLGLAISYGIVESHGGHIEVNSEPGHGTQFMVYLPTIHQGSAQALSDQAEES